MNAQELKVLQEEKAKTEILEKVADDFISALFGVVAKEVPRENYIRISYHSRYTCSTSVGFGKGKEFKYHVVPFFGTGGDDGITAQNFYQFLNLLQAKLTTLGYKSSVYDCGWRIYNGWFDMGVAW